MRCRPRALLIAALLGSACGGSGMRDPDEFTGCGTDENWRTFDDFEGRSTVGDATAPVFTAPAPGPVPASPKPVFGWAQDPNDPGAPDGDVPHVQGPDCMNCCPEFNIGQLSTLHLPPISGHVYDLQAVVDGAVAYRVITTLQEWTPPDSVWASWRGKTVTIKLFGMQLLRNDLKQGPFVAATASNFTVGR
jgi:hypothetical protein